MPKQTVLPQHVGIILDGNRRWAKAQGLTSLQGHLKGYRNFHDVALYLLKTKKVPYVSAYVFSTENWSRTKSEVNYLMKLVLRALKEFLKEFHEEGIRIVVLGSREKLSKSVIKAIDKAESDTHNNNQGTLALCFNYGGQGELVEAAKAIINAELPAESVTPSVLADHLYHPEVPPLDLIIRTSGEQRLSGFMLWRAAYAELYFVDKHWPDFGLADTDEALADYSQRQRRFGK